MNLIFDNLSDTLRPGVLKDIADVTRMARAAGVHAPSCSLHVIALDEPGVPDDLPAHELITPDKHEPAPVAQRCDWQTLRDSFQLITQAGDARNIWVIAGSSTGAMYGVNEILCATTGVIFAGQSDEDVLFGPTYSLPTKPQRPRMAYRGFYGANTTWAARHRINFGMSGAAYFASIDEHQRHEIQHRLASRGIVRTRSEHAMDLFMPPELLKQNKAWQGMRQGERCTHAHVVMPDCPGLNSRLPVQPCYSNVQVRKVIVQKMAQLCQTQPTPKFFGVWPHDGVNNWCECDACVKLAPFEHMHRLALELREHLPADNTTAMDLIVYSNMLNLPRQAMKENDRAVAFFCPYLRPFRHGVFDEGGPDHVMTGNAYPEPDRINPEDEREYGLLFHQWLSYWNKAKITPALFEYPGHFIDETGRTDLQRYGHAPTAAIREKEAIQYASLGLRIAILCGQPCPWPDHFQDIAWAQTLWGNEPVDNIRHRYYTAVAGELGDQLADAIDGVVAALKDSLEVPIDAMTQLHLVLDQLADSTQKTAYQDWMHIIKLGRESFGHRLAGQPQLTTAMEKSLRDFIKKHEQRIAPSERLIHFSNVYEQRATQQHTGHKSMQYTL